MAGPSVIFDRAAVRRHRERAAPRAAEHGFLFDEVARRLGERLADVRRDFPLALDLGGRAGAVAGSDKIGRMVRAAPTPAALYGAPGPAVAADEEFLPFADASLDLVVGACTLHWVNDLPGALIQLRRALKPDGLLLAALFGGTTLHELRAALALAESAEEGGASPRLSPLAEVRDAGDLLQRAGFALPMVDVDEITVTYADAFALMRDLRGMGETNAVAARRRRFTRRATMMAAAAAYRERFGDASGRIPATFQVLFLTAWAPHESQPRPLRPGSAGRRLADALDTRERPAGDKARPR